MFYCTVPVESVLRNFECNLRNAPYTRMDEIKMYPGGMVVHDSGTVRVRTANGKSFVVDGQIPIPGEPERIIKLSWSRFVLGDVESTLICETEEFSASVADSTFLSFKLSPVEVGGKRSGVLVWPDDIPSRIVLRHELQKYNAIEADMPEGVAQCILELLSTTKVIPPPPSLNNWRAQKS